VAANPDDWAAKYYLAGAEACEGKSGEAMKQGMNCPALAKPLWQVQGTAEDNQVRRHRNSSH